MEFTVYSKGKKLKLEVKKCGFLLRGRGLTFKSRKTNNLLFEFKKDSRPALTAFFVFFDFLVLWLDGKNRVIDFRIVRPFEFHINTKRSFRKVIEIPINYENRNIVKFFVGK